MGSYTIPIWRVVVADRRSPRDGRFIEAIGHYNPQTQPSTIVIDHERLDHWLRLGAEPTNTVKKLMRAKDNPQAEAEPEAPVAVVEEATEAEAESEADAPADVAGATEPDITADAAEGESGEQPA